MSKGSGRFLAVVPARGGSKRIPRKNIRHSRRGPLAYTPLGSISAHASLTLSSCPLTTRRPSGGCSSHTCCAGSRRLNVYRTGPGRL
jgi:hypothetical protein